MLMDIVGWITANIVTVLAVLGGLRLAAAALAKLTPTKSDDEFVARVESWLDRLGSLFLVKKTDALKMVDATKEVKEVIKAQDLKDATVAADVKEALVYAKARKELLPEGASKAVMSPDLHKALLDMDSPTPTNKND